MNELKQDLTIGYSFKDEADKSIYYKLVNIIDECYKLDTNSIPPTYHLLPIPAIIPDFNSKNVKKKENSQLFWQNIDSRLSKLLRDAVNSALKKKRISQTNRDRYFVSSNT